MTLLESGMLAGVPTGAIVGGVIGNAHGVAGVVGGSLAGVVAGAAAGWLYAFLVILLLSVIGVFWRVARRRADTDPTEADMQLMTPIGRRGILFGAMIALACWLNLGWPQALMAAVLVGAVTAIIAVARCELR